METEHEAGKDLLHLVRLGFYRKRSSLNAWCKKNGISRQYATQSLLGKRPTGSAEKALKARLLKESQ